MLSNQTSSKDQSSYPSAYAHSLAAMGIEDPNVSFSSPEFKGQSKLIRSQSSNRDCSKVGTAVRAFKTYQKEQGARRRQQGGFGAIAGTLIVGGLLSIYFWSLIPGLVILGLGVLGAVCLPMIKKPQLPNHLNILPSFDNPDAATTQRSALKAKSKPETAAREISASRVAMSTSDLALQAKAAPVLFSESQKEEGGHKSHKDTFDIVASKKMHSKRKKK